ncbi:GNAT family N-acetyltransferase [Parvularcula sp. IMCC14364]|uniref:GNAT family N-acetyltransferase n=1 Tax=Parvularcula sp. IMCC14364 TaxID=3067902 RepID=UPI00274268B7|nr:GNAT family N-acetyltransferase [Parvularcula sp. IMCC14364]
MSSGPEYSEIRIREGWGRAHSAAIIDLHRRGYVDQDSKFHNHFSDFVAVSIDKSRLDEPDKGRIWFAERDGKDVGCVAIIDRDACCQFRWFVVVPEVRGLGVGKQLFQSAIEYARMGNWSEVYLETVDGLEASADFYRREGFVETARDEIDLWYGKGEHLTMTLKLV